MMFVFLGANPLLLKLTKELWYQFKAEDMDYHAVEIANWI